jgi:molecular chaperone GrpE
LFEPLRVADPLPEVGDELSRMRAQRNTLAVQLNRAQERHAEEIERERRLARNDVLRDVLEVLDNLEKAVEANPDRTSTWYQGHRQLVSQTEAVLERHGARRFGAPGDRFDPTVHEALAAVPSDTAPEGSVVFVERPGFRYADGRMLRPARVIVAS